MQSHPCPLRRYIAPAASLLASLVFTWSGKAQVAQNYDPTHPSTVWDLSTTNWDGSTLPWTNGNNAAFGGSGVTIDVNAAITAANLTFNAGGYVLADPTSNGTLTLGANGIVTVTTAGDTATVSEIVGGTNWSKAGAGTLVLSAANTFSGALTLSSGTLRATTDNAALGAGTLTLAGGILELANDTVLALGRNTTITGNTQIITDRLTSGAGVTHTLGTLTMGAQTLTVTRGSVTSSGSAGVSFGAVSLTAAATIVTEAGATTTLGATGAAITMGNNNLTIDGAGTTIFAGPTGPATTGAGQIIKNGTGLLSIIADPNNVGQFTINQGVVELNHGGSTDFAIVVNTDGTLRSLQADKLSDSAALTVNGVFDLRGSDSVGVLSGTGIITNGAASGSINLTLNGTGNGTFSGSIRNGDVSLGGSNGIVALVKTNTGTATLSGINTFTGSTTVTRGTLLLDFSGASAPTTNILYNGVTAGILAFNAGNNTGTAFLTLQGKAGTVDTPTVNSQTFGNLTVTGGVNTITLLSAANNTMNMTLGTISRSGAATMRFVAPTSGQFFTSQPSGYLGAAFTYTSSAGITSFAAVQGGVITAQANDLIYGTGANVTALPAYTATSHLLVDGTSTGNVLLASNTTTALTTLSFTDTASREIALNDSNTRLQLGTSGGVLMTASAGDLTIGSTGAAGQLTAGATGAGEMVLYNYSTSKTLTINSVIANNAGNGTVAVTLGGGGRIVFSNANTHTGVTTITNGVLQITHGSALGTVTIGTTVVAGGALELTGSITTLAEALSLSSTGISSGGGLRSVSGVNTYTGVITLGGTARINADSGSTLNLDVASGNAIVGGNNSLTFGGTGTIEVKDSFTHGGSSNPSITKDGTGTLILHASNTFSNTGTFTISAGVVRILNGGALGGTTGITSVSGGGALELSGGINTNENITLNNSTGISNAGAIRSILGDNTLSGTITVDNGTGRIHSDTGTLTLNNATTAIQGDPTASSNRIVVFGGAGNIVVAGGGAKNGTGANSALAVTKEGTGTLTMSTANIYTGATTISAGKMNVTGSLGATVISVNGGSLGGTGTIGTTTTATGGTVTVAGGTSIASRGALDLVDGAIGTLTIQGNTTANSTFLTLGGAAGAASALNFEVGTSTVDKIAITNTGRLTLNAGGAVVSLTALSGQTLGAGTYDLLTYATGSTITGTFSINGTPAPTAGGPVGGYNYTLNATSTALQLTVTASTLGNAWWTGNASSGSTVWNTNVAGDTNFATTSAGTTDGNSVLGSATNVFFAADNAVTTNFTTTLGQDTQINSLTFTGSGTPAAANAVTISGNTLTIHATNLNGNTAGNGLTVQAGSGNHTINSAVHLASSQSWTITDAATTFTVGGTLSGFNTLTKEGLGTLLLNGTNSFAGTVQINAGAVSTGLAAGLGSSIVSLGASGTLNLTAGNTTYTLAKLQGSGTVNVTTGTGTQITKIATAALAGHSTDFTGTLNITGGAKVQLENALGTGSIINVGSNATVFSSGIITYTSGLTLAGGDTGESIGQLRLDSGSIWEGAITLAGTISGTGDGFVGSNTGIGTIRGVIGESGGSRVLSKVGSGTIVLEAANTYTGGTSLVGGTLALGNKDALSSGILTVNGSANLQSTLALTGLSKILNNILLNATLTINGSAAIELAGSITQSGARGVTISNTAATTFSGSGNSFNLLTMNSGSVLNLTTDLTLAGATLIGGSGGTINGPGRILLNVGSGDIGVTSGNTLTINAVIANGTASNVDFWNAANGTGVVVLTADNTFTGTASIQSLIVSVSKIGNKNVVGNLGAGTIVHVGSASSATLRYTGTGESSDRTFHFNGGAGQNPTLDMSGTGVWKFTGDITSNTGNKVLTLTGSTTGIGEIAVAIASTNPTAVSVAKTGSGTWVLSGSSAYTGTTTISAGTLQVGQSGIGSIGNSATTVSGGYLAGTGTVNSTVTIQAAGTLRPGDNAGAGQGVFNTAGAGSNVIMSAAGARMELAAGANGISFAGSNTAPLDISGNLVSGYTVTANRVTGASDRVNSGGSIDLIAGGTVAFSLNGYTVNWGDGFDLLDWTTALNLNGFTIGDRFRTGTAADNLLYDLDLPDITAINANWVWDTSLFASHGILVAVPEPSRALLLFAGLLLTAFRRRRSA
ncbi:autotransporter-associated beta strand repeat-containing protein [Verrucomicrobium sp. BvORR106]|uniref:autotransporter-associated beta strand repeat-containing protein n=1 Tax=Verrucomicrobium sp. BvORR106 TaxID=1403819 RepID=UPI00056E3E98|nr:autotransporter-associated beta strand repeat-containing protein [Verrucomicrobium sp. BvORR106]